MYDLAALWGDWLKSRRIDYIINLIIEYGIDVGL